MKTSISSPEEIKTFCKRSMCSIHHPMCSRVKQLLTYLSSRNRLICGNQLLVLMRTNCFPTQCVNLCQQDSTCIGISIRRTAVTLRKNKTRRFENVVMSYFCRKTLGSNFESFFITGRRTQTDCFTVDGSSSHCNLGLNLWDAFITFASVTKYFLLPLKTIWNAVFKRKNWMS